MPEDAVGRRKTRKKPVRKPAQGRAHATVDAIVEATAHILVERGYAKTTTNHIAKKAGVSVASFYDYFENKDAAIAAVALNLMRETRAHAVKSANVLLREPPMQALRGWLMAMSDFALEHAALIRTLMQEAAFAFSTPEIAGGATDIVREIQPFVFAQRSVPHEWLTEERLQLITVTAAAAILQTTVDPRTAARRNELIDELVRMITGYVAMTAMTLQKK